MFLARGRNAKRASEPRHDSLFSTPMDYVSDTQLFNMVGFKPEVVGAN